MRKQFTLLIIPILFIQISTFGQKVVEFEIPKVSWENWDRFHNDSLYKIPFFYSLGADQSFQIDYANQLKVLDIDGMTPDDLIYISPDTSSLQLFVNHGNVLTRVFQTENDLIEISRSSPLSPIKFVTSAFDSINYEHEFNHYTSVIKDGRISYSLERTDILKDGMLDLYGNMPPSSFKVTYATPLVTGPGLEQLIRRLSVGEVGYAIASVESKPGEHWWKVYIQEPDYRWRLGWLRRANVATVYQGSR